MNKKQKRPSGELRRGQVLTTYGPGAMVDLPHRAVLIGGLEFWSENGRRRIEEERLAMHIARLHRLETRLVDLYEPPVDEATDDRKRTGISAMLFPLWFLGPVLDKPWEQDGRTYRTRPLLHWRSLDKGKHRTGKGKSVAVTPIRFVRACRKGHLADIHWHAFVHRDYQTKYRGELFLDEGGASNELAEILVRCGITGRRRRLSEATIETSLGRCPGLSPWLGDHVHESCDEFAKLLVRSASNAYFAQTLPVISIPDADQKLKDAVAAVWEDHLQYLESYEELVKENRRTIVQAELEGIDLKRVWTEIDRRRKGFTPENKKIKQVEIETLLNQEYEVGEDAPDGDFYARRRSLAGLAPYFQERIDRIVLVHRLREVLALVGFTRFEPVMPDIDGELDMNVEVAPIGRAKNWFPAVEHKGEGVFIGFKKTAIDQWLTRSGTLVRAKMLEAGFTAFYERREKTGVPFVGAPYYMLHSLAHLLITAVSLECGYPSSSIRERIYAGKSGYGILLYTGGSGSEGTLGGLIEVGRRIERHLARALELGRLCSNDPICAQHEPTNVQEERFLHGAACHGCLLIAETCCERRNLLLDRSLVIPTVSCRDAAFFPDEV